MDTSLVAYIQTGLLIMIAFVMAVALTSFVAILIGFPLTFIISKLEDRKNRLARKAYEDSLSPKDLATKQLYEQDWYISPHRLRIEGASVKKIKANNALNNKWIKIRTAEIQAERDNNIYYIGRYEGMPY